MDFNGFQSISVGFLRAGAFSRCLVGRHLGLIRDPFPYPESPEPSNCLRETRTSPWSKLKAMNMSLNSNKTYCKRIKSEPLENP